MKYWIKERQNPQTGTYYVACGQISEREAAREGRPIYGENVMHGYATEAEYLAEIARLKAAGERFV